MLRINVGCGASPTPGWVNFDNSLTVRLARHQLILRALAGLGLIGPEQCRFAAMVVRDGIRWANAVRRIPVPDGSAEIVYCSHMLEHLERDSVLPFLAELRRALAPGGIIRLVLPDLRMRAERYLSDGDADAFVTSTSMAVEPPRGIGGKLRWFVVGPRHHLWMYDGLSLLTLLSASGFHGAVVLPAGETTITAPGDLNLREREEESVYVEARRP